MATWQHDVTGDRFDDGLTAKPGDEDFTRDVAAAHFKSAAFSYVGTPDWVAPEPEPIEPEPQPVEDEPVEGDSPSSD